MEKKKKNVGDNFRWEEIKEKIISVIYGFGLDIEVKRNSYNVYMGEIGNFIMKFWLF